MPDSGLDKHGAALVADMRKSVEALNQSQKSFGARTRDLAKKADVLAQNVRNLNVAITGQSGLRTAHRATD